MDKDKAKRISKWLYPAAANLLVQFAETLRDFSHAGVSNERTARDYGSGHTANYYGMNREIDLVTYLAKLGLVEVVYRDRYDRYHNHNDWEEPVFGRRSTYRNVKYKLTEYGKEVAMALISLEQSDES